MPVFGDNRLPVRFWGKAQIRDTCWVWTACTHKGYGQFRLNGRIRTAHRVAYEALVGPVPTGLQLDHLCRNRSCFNPAHLEPVTNLENSRRSPIKVPLARERARLHNTGADNGQAKLLPADILRVRELYFSGWLQKDIARAFAISQQQVSNIVNRRKWASVGEPVV